MAAETDGKPMAEVVRSARLAFEELTGRRIESVSGAAREDGAWRISFEVVELERVPDSTSLLGSYEAIADEDGALIEYGRVRRYYRNRADEEA